MPKQKKDKVIPPENENLNVADGVDETAETEPANIGEAKETAEKPGYVKYSLPYAPGAQPGDYESVGLNGINYHVQYGVEVFVPVGVAEILNRRRRQAIKYAEKLKEAQKNECIAIIEN